MSNLIEKAQRITSSREGRSDSKFKQNEVEDLALAWMKGEVTFTQIAKAMNLAGSAVYSHLAVNLKRAYGKGRITSKK